MIDPKIFAEQNPRGSAVLWYPDGSRESPRSAVIVSGPWRNNDDGIYRATIGPTWYRVPIEHLEPHPQRAALAALNKPEGGELDWPPPDCPHCGVPVSFDDHPYCEQCGTSWDSSGGEGTRRCVECDDEAVVVGADEQPRCAVCQLHVIIGELDPTGPYECRGCRTRVVGIGCERPAGKERLCGQCHQRKESDRWWAEHQARRNAAG